MQSVLFHTYFQYTSMTRKVVLARDDHMKYPKNEGKNSLHNSPHFTFYDILYDRHWPKRPFWLWNGCILEIILLCVK